MFYGFWVPLLAPPRQCARPFPPSPLPALSGIVEGEGLSLGLHVLWLLGQGKGATLLTCCLNHLRMAANSKQL